ncbi:flavodoxin [Anoxybacillus sp. TBDG-1]
MSKVIMIFTSMTGNTEEMAEAIAEGVREQGIELDVKEVLDATATELGQYDGILLGAYTWGDGELPDDFLDFYDELDDVDLTGKKAAVFGSCDSSYEKYGAAVDILIEKLQQRGAEVILDGLKIELTPTTEDKQLCITFGRDFAKQL